MSTRDFPDPDRERWQPLRAGLIDLFYYDNEEFFFRDGRLLLRGNNGTGKSKVLALTLPFLLDGELAAHRVEPDADSKKRMEWNLLLGGEHPFGERLGYTWVEFGRLDADGTPHFRTLGCGLKAVSGRGITRHWFFVTTQRPGADLNLVDATGTALTRDRLIDALDGHGTVYDRARDYRRAVDEALFGFGEQRYGALVDLLVQLRQPQLSKRPSENALSAALTEALPPMDQAVLADVAEAFRSLEEDRDTLTAMTQARDAARRFLQHYRRYARIAARRRAAEPRDAEGVHRRVREDLRAAQEAHAEARTALEAAESELAELEETREQLTARQAALREGPEARSARELTRADEDARHAEAAAEKAAGARDEADAHVAEMAGRNEEARGRLEGKRAELTTTRQSTVDIADEALIGDEHRRRVDEALDDPGARHAAEQIAESQARAIKYLRTLAAAVDAARNALAKLRERLTGLDADADELAERRRDADEQVARAGQDHVAAVREHLTHAEELRLADVAATLAELELWVETLQGTNPARTAVDDAAHHAAAALAAEDARLQTDERAANGRSDELASEIDRLERGEDTAPPVPYTRDDPARADRPGAPLWGLIDFADGVSTDDHAGLEAALEAAGILDAWVTPRGELLDIGTGDVLLRAGKRAASPVSAVLMPAVDREDPQANAVSDETVGAMLAAIGLGENADEHTWVARDGRFRNGVLTGSWHKESAVYIGRGAREAARRARLEQLREELDVVGRELAELAQARAAITARQDVLRRETNTLPGDEPLRHAHSTVAALVDESARLEKRRAQVRREVADATTAARDAIARRDETAADTGLPYDPPALDGVTDALHRYRLQLAALWPAITAERDALRAFEQTTGDLNAAVSALAQRETDVTTTRQQAAAAKAHYDTLRSTVGAAVEELHRQLAAVADELETTKQEHKATQLRANDARGKKGKAEGKMETLQYDLENATEQRRSATEAFRRFVGLGLLAVALPELDVPDPTQPWAPDPTVRLARRVNDELSDVTDDDGAHDRALRHVNDELKTLQDTLSRQGHRAVADLHDDGVMVQVEFRGKTATVPELAEALATEVGDRETLLSEREREILENHLIGEVASTLQELITAAEAQVAAMNHELEQRPTSTGMRLRLAWTPRDDGPTGLAEARRRLLRQSSDAWSDEDRTAVGSFLQERINEVRATEQGRTWLEQLTVAMDYRAWNRFVIQVHQNGQWRPATGPASGGERVLAASVPLFAAASSHYASAGNPHAPRLVTLDEAFAGVDDNARAKYLGLLAAFDLDVVMTSEREWGCYPQVPGLAISQLSRVDGVAAVLVTNWEWDGNRRREAHRRIHPVPEQPHEVPAEGLFE